MNPFLFSVLPLMAVSSSDATFRWSAEVSVLDMVPRQGAVAYILSDGTVVDRIEFAGLSTMERPDTGGALDHDDFRPTAFAPISGETPVDGFAVGTEFDLVVKAWIDRLAEECDWFNMAANPFVLGESDEPHLFLLSCGISGDTEAPAERGRGWTTVAAVPEPGPAALALLGLLPMARRRFRRPPDSVDVLKAEPLEGQPGRIPTVSKSPTTRTLKQAC